MPSQPAAAGRLRVIVNSVAGLGRRDPAPAIEEALAAAGVEAVVQRVDPEGLDSAVAASVREGAAMVGVAGGDGTLLTAAGRLAGSETVLAPMPAGTLNHFARRLGLPDHDSAARAIRGGSTRTVPLGVMDDRVFLNTAILGFYADVVRRRDRYRPVLGKWGAAGVAFAATLARLRMMDVSLVLEGERLERRTALVWIGVGWGSFPLVHDSPQLERRPDLEIVVLKPGGIFSSAGMVVRLFRALRRRKRPISDPSLEILHARELLIEGHHRIGVTLDGEAFRVRPPIYLALQDDALRVVGGNGTDRTGDKGKQGTD